MSNPVMHWQMVTSDPEKISAFYAAVFGWKISAANAMGYRMIEAGAERGIGGGIWPSQPGSTELTQIYVEVDDIENSLARIVAQGGKVLVGKQVLPDGDAMALATDPLGRPFGLMTAGKK